MLKDEYVLKIMLMAGFEEQDMEDTELQTVVKAKAAIIIGYLNSGGASLDSENLTDYELGVVANGVNDLLNNTAGGTELSSSFKIFAGQLCTNGVIKNG